MAAGDFAQAAVLYGELVRALPDNPDLKMNLGLALESAGRYREAATEFGAVVKARPNYAEAWLLLGMAHAKLDKPAEAVAPLKRALQLQPTNKMALLELGDAYLESGDAGDAVGSFERLTQLDAGSAKAWQALGLSYNALARGAFERLEKVAPESSYWYALAAGSKREQQQYAAAFYLYRRAAEAEPQPLPGVHAGLAEVYRRTGHADWAQIEDAREAEVHAPRGKAVPGSPRAYYEEALRAAGKALVAFGRLSQLPPTAELRVLMGQAARIQGNYVQAQQEFHEALKLEPGNRAAEAQLAQTLWLAHDFDTALPMLERLVKTEPDSAELNFELGDTWLEKNEAAQALPLLQTALKLKPGWPAADASLGRAYLQLHQPAQAIPHLRAALAVGKDGSVHYQLARAYRENGQEALARQASADFRKQFSARQERREEMERAAQITAPD